MRRRLVHPFVILLAAIFAGAQGKVWAGAPGRDKRVQPAEQPSGPVNLPKDPEGFVQDVLAKLGGGDLGAVWQALPPTYREDLSEIVHLFGRKMDPEVWAEMTGPLRRLPDILERHEHWGLESLTRVPPGPAGERTRKAYREGVGVLKEVANSGVFDLDGLRTFDLGRYMMRTAPKLMQQALALSSSTPGPYLRNQLKDIGSAKVKMISRDGDTALVDVAIPGEAPQQVQLVRVEGRWLPQKVADWWKMHIPRAKESLRGWDAKSWWKGQRVLRSYFKDLRRHADRMQGAKTGEDFAWALLGYRATLLLIAGELDIARPAIKLSPGTDPNKMVTVKLVGAAGGLSKKQQDEIKSKLGDASDSPSSYSITSVVPSDDRGTIEVRLEPVRDLKGFVRKLTFLHILSISERTRTIVAVVEGTPSGKGGSQ